MSNYEIITKEAVFGSNYKIGYIGFVWSGGVISEGITYFTRHENLSGIMISHVLVVTGKNTCVEAIMGKGVVESDLQECYFSPNNKRVTFRAPASADDDTLQKIGLVAQSQIGKAYDTSLIVGQAFSGSFLGRVLALLSSYESSTLACRWFNNNTAWICSELAAYCLQQQMNWAFHDKGILKAPPFAITPQRLFEDRIIFRDWH